MFGFEYTHFVLYSFKHSKIKFAVQSDKYHTNQNDFNVNIYTDKVYVKENFLDLHNILRRIGNCCTLNLTLSTKCCCASILI